MSMFIPKSMQAVQLDEYGGLLTLRECPVPRPGPGQVLIRMAASPINPSDLGFLRGGYRIQLPLPVVPGFEGSGTVVAAGSGLLPRLWSGKRVTCATRSGGAWAEYLVTSASLCFPLAQNLSFEQGAMLITNPMTALAFFDIAKRDKHAAIVSNAAASALGQMSLRLGQLYHLPIIHIVRRQAQVELLHSLGGEYILNSSDPDFHAQLRTLAHRLKATLILDPVAGEQTQELLDAAPPGSTALVYGYLSGKRSEITPQASGDKRVAGFYLPDWTAQRNVLQVLRDMRRVQRLAAKELQTTIQKRLPLAAAQQAVELSRSNPTAGKVLLVADPEKVRVD